MANWTGKQIQTLRCKLGLSQAEFARRLGINKRTLQGWGSGRLVSTLGSALLDIVSKRAGPRVKRQDKPIF